jgi:hypothetical protein
MAWTNNDGLYIKFGTEEATAGTAGEFRTNGAERVVRAKLTLTGLGTAAAIQDQHTVIPAGVRISEVKIINETAATSGGSAVLNIGLQRLDRSTELDYDGLVAAAALATFNAAGETQTLTAGSTGAGALVGTTTAYPGYITADYDTAAFTAGVLQVEIKYYKP